MELISNEMITYKTEKPGRPTRGHFGYKTDGDAHDIEWFHCREQIAAKICGGGPNPVKNFKGYYFCVEKDDDLKMVSSFINKVEKDVLELEDHTIFYKTNRNYTIWCKIPEFWTTCLVRASFYTMMLRAGLSYDKERDNFSEALFKEKYVIQTNEAVKRFLLGYTVYNESSSWPANSGWVRIFDRKTHGDVKKMLTAPSSRTDLNFMELMISE